MLCATLFSFVCGDSSLQSSTVVPLPCEVSTEALISDLELTRVSVDRFTAETTNLADGCALIGSVLQGYSKSRFNGSIQKLTSRPRIRVRDSPILSSRMPRPGAHVCSSASPPPAPSSVRAKPDSYSAPMSERLPTTWASALSLPGSSESARAGRLLQQKYDPENRHHDYKPELQKFCFWRLLRLSMIVWMYVQGKDGSEFLLSILSNLSDYYSLTGAFDIHSEAQFSMNNRDQWAELGVPNV